MATDKSCIANFLEGLWEVRVRPMMGEYVLYCRDKVVGPVCDNALFVKITPASERILAPLCTEKTPPYEGAKPHFKVEISDKQLIQELLFAVADDLPAPKGKR